MQKSQGSESAPEGAGKKRKPRVRRPCYGFRIGRGKIADLLVCLELAYSEADLGNARRAAEVIHEAINLVRGWQDGA